MNIKLSRLLIFVSTLLVGNSGHAYYGQNNAASKYYNGEMTADQYIDSMGVPGGQSQETTVYHNNGSKSVVRSNSSGGTIYNSDGSKSVYYNSR